MANIMAASKIAQERKKMVAIIDYDAGNIKSVEKAVNYLGSEAVLSRDREEILSADHIILPGVGNFGDAMEKINGFGLGDVIREAVDAKKPFLGICLGLQLMFENLVDRKSTRLNSSHM